jgi:hypothetical protein
MSIARYGLSVLLACGCSVAHEKTPVSGALPDLATARDHDAATVSAAADLAQPAGASRSFQSRCQSPGVVQCVSFDTSSDFVYSGPNQNIWPDAQGNPQASMDCTVAASGCSLKFRIPAQPHAANTAGRWTGLLGGEFGPPGFGSAGQTLYVQVRERVSQVLLDQSCNAMGCYNGEGWKQFGLFHGSLNSGTSCSAISIVVQNTFYRGIIGGGTDCVNRGFYTNNGTPPYLLQQGDYNCPYGNINNKDCAYYKGDQWMTYYLKVTLNGWNQPVNSFAAWTAYEGQPLKQFWSLSNWQFNSNSNPPNAGDTFNTIELYPYDTSLSGGGMTDAYVWYDELIVSTQPIPPPDGPQP